jgi:hypothetical protein
MAAAGYTRKKNKNGYTVIKQLRFKWTAGTKGCSRKGKGRQSSEPADTGIPTQIAPGFSA